MSAIHLDIAGNAFAALTYVRKCEDDSICPVGQHCHQTGYNTHICLPNDNQNHINPQLTTSKSQSKPGQTPVVTKLSQAVPPPTTVATPKTTAPKITTPRTQLPTPTPAHPCAGLTGSNLTRCLDANKAINTASQNIPSSFLNRNKPLNVKVSGSDNKTKQGSGNIPITLKNPPPITTHGHPQRAPKQHVLPQNQVDPTTLPLCPAEGDFDRTKCYTPPTVPDPITGALQPMNDPTAKLYQKTGGITAGGQTSPPGTGFGFLNKILSNPTYLIIGAVLVYFLFFYHGKHHRR